MSPRAVGKPSSEAIWWALFSAGGVMAALFIPAFVLVTGFVLPTATTDTTAARFERVHDTVGWWPVRIILFGIIFLCFFHCAHRIRHTLMDLGLRPLGPLLMVLCYGGALAGTIATAVALLKI